MNAISGDFNLHADNPENSYANELLSLLGTFNLPQHIQGPCIPLVIHLTWSSKSVDIPLTVKDLALSDHSCIFLNAFTKRSFTSAVVIGKRIINDHINALFE